MKLWGGRFSGRSDPRFEEFSESFSLDQRFIFYDLEVNLAYVKALGRAGALKPREVQRLASGLEGLRRYVRRNPHWARRERAEDVHTWVEQELERRVGDMARKLRTGRSRNDLVATETRLYIKDATLNLERVLADLLGALVKQARKPPQAVMPGFTHLQPAQPVLFSHYLLAYFEMFLRDVSRLQDCRTRSDELPMGAGALAGTTFAINRERLARELGFARVARNSLDVTSDRDPGAELLFACALCMIHLSRLAEDLIIYSSPAFGFVEIADAYSTGSSHMPQKKNPDSLELIRGRAGTLMGKLAGMLAVLKSLPMAYDRDLQEDKAAMFRGVDITQEALAIAGRVVTTLRVHPKRMKAATQLGFLTATDVADELVRRGVSFAEAHEQVGRLVHYSAEVGKTFEELAMDEAVRWVPAWDSKLRAIAISAEASLARRNVAGGTAPRQVVRQLAAAERAVSQLKSKLH